MLRISGDHMRPEKKAIFEEVQGRLGKAGFVFLVNYRGLKSDQMTDLRSLFRHAGAKVQVVKNTILQRVASDLGCGDISGIMEGPTAVITGDGDVTEAAKLLDGYIRDNNLPVVRGGLIGKKIISSDDIGSMARIPPRIILLGRFVGTVAAPMTRLVGVMNQKVLTLLYVLKAIEKKKGGQ
jgi:large subunit ribosomal protein L10